MNIANVISQRAAENPRQIALIAPKNSWLNFIKSYQKKYDFLTFDELEKRSGTYANTLIELGFKKGMKSLVFITPGVDFSPVIFALFRMGVVPVLIDPGMGVDSLVHCIEEVKAQALVGIPKIHFLKKIKSSYFKSVEISVVVGGNAFGAISLEKASRGQKSEFQNVEMGDEELGAILFTSGGTGKPKGVLYTQKIFYEQTLKLKQMFLLSRAEVDLACFPLFSLFTLSIGMTSCVPELDITKPARINPKKLVKNLLEHKATFTAGSPAIFEQLATYCVRKKIKLSTLKYLVTFGAPVSAELIKKLKSVVTHGEIYTPYGATECLPVTIISGSMILGETSTLTNAGAGTCVGFAAPGVEYGIITSGSEKKNLEESDFLASGEKGEVIVCSETVTKGYWGVSEDKSKLSSARGTWHRMGDTGYVDQWGRLWFCGRSAHCFFSQGLNYYPICVEAVFNQHPAVKRSALVNLGDRPGLVVQRVDSRVDFGNNGELEKFLQELLRLGNQKEHTAQIKDIFLKEDFPVDTRHNIKIDREALSRWAREQV